MTEPATRPEPGTPLPWGWVGLKLVAENGAWVAFATGVAEDTDIEIGERDAVYLAHAANKLPELEADRARLVAMLKDLESSSFGRIVHSKARTLLADLGEGSA